MKRLRKKLLEDFCTWSIIFKYRGFKFKYCENQTIFLKWRTDIKQGRIIELICEEKIGWTKIFKHDLSDVPLPIIKSSVKFFEDKWISEKKRE